MVPAIPGPYVSLSPTVHKYKLDKNQEATKSNVTWKSSNVHYGTFLTWHNFFQFFS